jgi:hypothetical protein
MGKNPNAFFVQRTVTLGAVAFLWFQRFVYSVLILAGLLTLSGGIPVNAAVKLRSVRQSTGYWRFLEPVITKADKDLNAASEDVSVSEGQSSLTRIYGGDEPTKYVVDCTWTWSAPNGMDRLNPGDMLNGTMTLTDRSELFHTYDGYDHGYSGNSGDISIDQPYIGSAYTGGAQTLLNFSVVWKQSNTAQGQLAIPNGPGWDGKMGLKAKCSWNVYERVYEWVPAEAAAPVQPGVTPVTTESGQPSEPGTNSGGLSWILVVGGLAALAAAVVAVVAGLGVAAALILRGRGPKAPSKQPAPPRYVLQLSARSLEVRVGQSTSLGIQAWRITPEGATLPAPDAVINVLPPPSSTGLVVTPLSGLGTLQCIFTVAKSGVCTALPVTVTALAQGIQTSAQVDVRIVPMYALQLVWQEPAQQPQPGGAEVWAFAQVIATPPDPQSPPEQITSQVLFTVQGSNSDWVRLRPTGLNSGLQYVAVASVPPTTDAALKPGSTYLVAQVKAGDQDLQAQLAIELNTELFFDVWIQGKKQADVIYSDNFNPPGWLFGGLTAYFHYQRDDNKPIVPPFKTNLSNPEVHVEPADILELKNPGEERPGWFTADVELRPGVDLEQIFGPDLTEKNAQIQLTLSVTDDTGKPQKSTVTYQLCPTVELVLHACDEDGNFIQNRDYAGCELQPYELVTDANDTLYVGGFFRRTDWPTDSGRVLSFGSMAQGKLVGSRAPEFIPSADEVSFVPVNPTGLWRSEEISADRPILYSKERLAGQLSLHVEGDVEKIPAHYRLKNKALDQELKPLDVHLNLWIIPGQQRGTSLAAGIAGIQRKDGKLELLQLNDVQEVEFDLRVQREEMTVQVEPLGELFYSTGGTHIESQAVPSWLQAWRLTYFLRWDAVKNARFTAYFSFAGMEERVSYTVKIAENGAAMFAALNDAADRLDLTNREWQNPSLFWGLDFILKRECRGIVYNLRNFAYQFFYGEDSVPDAYKKYTCGEYSKRLRQFLLARRHGKEDPHTALAMNGIECCQYTLQANEKLGLHDWCGIHFGGNPTHDPVFIDPWHIQEWDPSFIQDNFGFKKQTAYLLLEVTFVFSEVIVIGGYVFRFLVRYAPAGIRNYIGKSPRLQNILPSPGKPVFQQLPTLSEVLQFFKEKVIDEMIWPALTLLAGGTAWWTSSARNSDSQYFDENFNYTYYSELELLKRLMALPSSDGGPNKEAE